MADDSVDIGTVVALIDSISKTNSAKYESIGIKSISPYDSGIEFVLADNVTKIQIPVSGWHSLTTDEQATLAKLVPVANNGASTFIGGDLNRYPTNFNQTNDNKVFNFSASEFTKVSDNEYYTDIKHGLNDFDIIPAIVNSSNQGCFEGWETTDADTIRITTDAPYNGKIIINYSVSNGSRINNIACVNSVYIFTSNANRDAYFSSNLNALQNGLVIIVNDNTNPEVLYTWNSIDKPTTYDNTKWSNSTALIKGAKGDKGDVGAKGDTGVSAYQGVYNSKSALETAFPTGLSSDKFAVVDDGNDIFLANYISNTWNYKIINNKVIFKKDSTNTNLCYRFDDETDDNLKVICPLSDLKGAQGIQGIQGITGESAYDTAVEKQSFSGTEVEWLENLNSCLGKFSSLADLKVAYPSGTDPYKFAIISTVTGQVGIAFYDKSVSNWQVTVFASTNGSAVVTDDKSVGKNSLGNLQINGFENASNNTIPSKDSSGEVKYLSIEKSNTNTFSTIASKEYVDESMVGGLAIQNNYYDASTNTPNITTINTNGKSYGWIVLVAGTQTLGGNSITFNAFDLVIKTSGGAYLKIQNGTVSWGSIIGDITQQTDLINKLNEYAKIDDASTTSATTTYSAKHSMELIDKHRKIFMQSDSPVDMKKDDLWIDTTSIPYSLSSYSGTVWVSVGAAGGTKINDWVASTSYKVGEYVVKDSLLYRCTTANSDTTFIPTNWILISGHMIKDSTTMYTKRTNLQFTGNGVAITDDSANDSTVIAIKGDVTKTGTETLTNKTIDATNNTISNINTTNFANGIIDIDGTLASNSDTKIPSEKAIKSYINLIIGTIYPVGHILMTENSANPSTYLGVGTWVSYGAGKVPVGVDTSQVEFDTIGKTGGEKVHKLTIDEMPSHNHGYDVDTTRAGWNNGTSYGSDRHNSTSWTQNNGGDKAHNNLQPYVVCYMFKRVS